MSSTDVWKEDGRSAEVYLLLLVQSTKNANPQNTEWVTRRGAAAFPRCFTHTLVVRPGRRRDPEVSQNLVRRCK